MQRYKDFFKAFTWILNKAIEENIDFILISGDFIDSEQSMNPSILRDIIIHIQDFQAKCNEKVNKNIPILCIEGNHETPFFSDHTWLKLLADLDLIVLLSGDYDNKSNSLAFKEYSFENHSGGKIQIKNATIYGMSYFGMSTQELFPLIENEIQKEKEKFTVLMMHFGVSGQDKRKLGHVETLTPLIRLHDHIDYLALGHFHNYYALPSENPWIFNPGSLEVNQISEFDIEHGALLVEVYSKKLGDFKVRRLLCQNGNTEDPFTIPNRRFFALQSINISKAKSFKEAQDFIIDRLKRFGVPIKEEISSSEDNLDVPMLYLPIDGEVSYSQLEIDLNQLKERILNTFDILGIKIKNNISSQLEQGIQLDENLTFEQLEKELLTATIKTEEIFEPYKEKVVELLLRLKNDLNDKPDYEIIKSNLSTWTTLNNDLFVQIMQVVNNQKSLTKEIVPKKEKKKAKSKLKKQKKEESGEEFDFDKAFDFDELLDEKSDDHKEKTTDSENDYEGEEEMDTDIDDGDLDL